jgi:hypothetical protein
VSLPPHPLRLISLFRAFSDHVASPRQTVVQSAGGDTRRAGLSVASCISSATMYIHSCSTGRATQRQHLSSKLLRSRTPSFFSSCAFFALVICYALGPEDKANSTSVSIGTSTPFLADADVPLQSGEWTLSSCFELDVLMVGCGGP